MLKSRIAILSCFFILPFLLIAQHSFKGNIVDKDTREPIQGASVYINNSTIGTSSKSDGSFLIKLRFAGNYEVVVVAMGYLSYATTHVISSDMEIDIELDRNQIEIEEVSIVPYLNDGWKVWGKYFTNTFIGTNKFAKDTKLLNPEVLRFRYSKDEKLLTVSATDVLRIDNKALGYHLEYDLQDYRMDFGLGALYFDGFVFFKDFRSISKKHIQNRTEAYNSSLMRFVRSTYNNSWENDGYKVTELVRIFNQERLYAEEKLLEIRKDFLSAFKPNWNSYLKSKNEYERSDIQYYTEKLKEPKYVDQLKGIVLSQNLFTGNEEAGMKEISFSNYLHVASKTIEQEKMSSRSKPDDDVAAVLKIDSEATLWLDAFGNYYPLKAWIMEGYLGWYNKVSSMLPIDYEIDSK